MLKKNKFKKAVSGFFEDDNLSSKDDEVSLKTLVTVFVIGLVIILALYLYNSSTSLESNIEESLIIDYENITPEEILSTLNINKSIVEISDITKVDLNKCFYKVQFKNRREDILTGLIDSNNTEGVSTSGRNEIITRYQEPKRINSIIVELKTDEPSILSITLGNGDEFSDPKIIKIEESSEWKILFINTTEQFIKEDYKFISFDPGEGEIMHFRQIILCE